MPPPHRPLTQFEQPIALHVVRTGTVNGWEYAAFLESPAGPLVEVYTSMNPQCVTLSPKVLRAINAGTPIVVHHNHLSQESLSDDDWSGLCTKFAETFAHCADGTIYWGRVINQLEVQRVIAGPGETNAMNKLFSVIQGHPDPRFAQHPAIAQIAFFYRKEVLNRAMHCCGFVDYGASWGASNIQPTSPNPSIVGSAGLVGSVWDQLFDDAATSLAPTL